MRRTLIACLTLAAACAASMHARAEGSPVLVELFTSEGCSSCPPADALLRDLTKSARAREGGTILIAWHVDYWDHLGWADRFGLAEATRRQRAYSEAMKTRGVTGAGVYTPQMIIGGGRAVVGNDRGAVREAIAGATKGGARPLEVAVTGGGDTLTVTATVGDLPEGATVMAVLVEDGLKSKVTAGENKGKTLAHERVARAAAVGEVAGGVATMDLAIPGDVVRANASVVVFEQAPEMGEILAAGAAGLGAPSASHERYQSLAIGEDEIRYALILPDGFDPARSYPVMLALPPGAQNQDMVETALGMYWEAEAKARGWIVVSPLNPGSAELFRSPGDPLGALMDDIVARFKVEGEKFHLTGVSNGGRAAFLAAVDHPGRFASLTVLPGLLAGDTPAAKIKELRGVPITMFVGGDDSTWVREANRTVGTLKEHGVGASLTVLAGQGHVVSIRPETLFDLLDKLR